VGRETSANTDILLHAEILSWSRSRGLFAGLSLEGATLRPDTEENEKLYGKGVTNKSFKEKWLVPKRGGRWFLPVIDTPGPPWRAIKRFLGHREAATA